METLGHSEVSGRWRRLTVAAYITWGSLLTLWALACAAAPGPTLVRTREAASVPFAFASGLSEYTWLSFALFTALAVPLGAACVSADRAGALRRRFALRVIFALLSVGPLWIALVLVLLRWGYVD